MSFMFMEMYILYYIAFDGDEDNDQYYPCTDGIIGSDIIHSDIYIENVDNNQAKLFWDVLKIIFI